MTSHPSTTAITPGQSRSAFMGSQTKVSAQACSRAVGRASFFFFFFFFCSALTVGRPYCYLYALIGVAVMCILLYL